jgi:hypothetical protein
MKISRWMKQIKSAIDSFGSDEFTASSIARRIVESDPNAEDLDYPYGREMISRQLRVLKRKGELEEVGRVKTGPLQGSVVVYKSKPQATRDVERGKEK